MTLPEIKNAIDNNKIVYWKNHAYRVIKDNLGQYFIQCQHNQHCIGLTWQDNMTLNGKESDFFI